MKKVCCRRYLSCFVLSIFVSLMFIPLLQSSNIQVSPEMNTTSITYSLNGDHRDGFINQFGQINCGPLPNWDKPYGADLTTQYQQTGLSHIRTHDFFGPTDISHIFPDWNADVNDLSSYNFSLSDTYITGIIEAGCQVFYRLGESASDQETLRKPPENATKWSEICKHIVMHYNEGWNEGFYYNITYWEIWNEPDLSGFWNGTAEQYYHLYHTVATTLKTANASLKIGGPCTSSVYNENYTNGFLDYVKKHNLPLDFFSWHMYADTPYQLCTATHHIQKLLDGYGFVDTENINTEWNINLLFPQRDNDNAKNAAFTACALTCFHDTPLDYAYRYRGTQDDNWLMKLIGFDIALFTIDGVFKTPALAYLALHYMTKDTPYRLQTMPMNCSDGITLLAGISEDKSNISILLSNYEAESTDIFVELTNLANTNYSLVIYTINDELHLETTEQMEISNKMIISTHLEQNTVQFIRLTTSSVLPAEGPEVAEIPLILKLPFLDPIFQTLGFLILLLIFG